MLAAVGMGLDVVAQREAEATDRFLIRLTAAVGGCPGDKLRDGGPGSWWASG